MPTWRSRSTRGNSSPSSRASSRPLPRSLRDSPPLWKIAPLPPWFQPSSLPFPHRSAVHLGEENGLPPSALRFVERKIDDDDPPAEAALFSPRRVDGLAQRGSSIHTLRR